MYELIVQSQADRLEDQRSELGGRSSARVSSTSSMNEEIVSDLVQKMQVGRIEEQRAMLGSGSRGATPNRDDKFSQNGVCSACDNISVENSSILNTSGTKALKNTDGGEPSSPIVTA